MTKKLILTVDEAARELGMDAAAVRQLARSGDLPGAFKAPGSALWKIPLSSVHEYVARTQKAWAEDERNMQ